MKTPTATKSNTTKPSIRTGVKAGFGGWLSNNHTQTKIRTGVKSGLRYTGVNHSQRLLRSRH